MSDSLKLEITGDDKDRLIAALNLCPTDKITGVVWTKNSLVMEWEHDHKLPQQIAFRPALMADVIMDWLGRSKGSNSTYAAPDWPKGPDIDGDVEKGWRIEADNRKITVHPYWMIYHK